MLLLLLDDRAGLLEVCQAPGPHRQDGRAGRARIGVRCSSPSRWSRSTRREAALRVMPLASPRFLHAGVSRTVRRTRKRPSVEHVSALGKGGFNWRSTRPFPSELAP